MKLSGWIGRQMLLSALAVSLLGAQQDPAHELAKKVDQHYNQLRSLKSTFTESYEGLGMHRSESGTLLLVKPGKMRWDYTQPSGKVFVLDGQNAWFYTRGSAQVQKTPAKKLDDLRSPLRFLLGHTQLEKELTNLQLGSAGGKLVLSGVPKGQEKRLRKLALAVTPGGSITTIEMEETDGAVTRFIFSNEEPNAAIPAAAFEFHPPAGIPVVDALPPV